MLKYIRFKNAYSFAEETEISFVLNKQPAVSYYDINLDTGDRINKVIAVIGANGSGKTQFLKPLAFISWFICRSYLDHEPNANIPFDGHKLKPDDQTSFEIGFIFKSIEYRYHLTFLKNQVIREALFIKSSRTFSYVFIREKLDDDGYSYKHSNFLKYKDAIKVRGNASLIAAAHNQDIELASEIVRHFELYESNINVFGRRQHDLNNVFIAAKFIHENPQYKNELITLLTNIDIGLCGVDIQESSSQEAELNETQVHYLPFGVHRTLDKEFTLPFYLESSGTQSAFVLLADLIPVLKNGGIAIIDELDNDLHPYLIPYITDLFKHSATNQFDAQLIFSCHTPEILNHLFKHQVYLVEKNNQMSTAWRLDQVSGVRTDDNLYAKYMAGALGAVPNL